MSEYPFKHQSKECGGILQPVGIADEGYPLKYKDGPEWKKIEGLYRCSHCNVYVKVTIHQDCFELRLEK